MSSFSYPCNRSDSTQSGLTAQKLFYFNRCLSQFRASMASEQGTAQAILESARTRRKQWEKYERQLVQLRHQRHIPPDVPTRARSVKCRRKEHPNPDQIESKKTQKGTRKSYSCFTSHQVCHHILLSQILTLAGLLEYSRIASAS
jgi:hypothetical protein